MGTQGLYKGLYLPRETTNHPHVQDGDHATSSKTKTEENSRLECPAPFKVLLALGPLQVTQGPVLPLGSEDAPREGTLSAQLCAGPAPSRSSGGC